MTEVMRLLYCCFTLALGLSAVCACAAEPARRGPGNPDEPWLFRTVLDDRPRVLVAALGDSAWAAWDTQACALYQVWKPGAKGVKLTGTVFDGKHGPQPSTDGQRVYQATAGPVWFADETGATAASVRYRAHRVGKPGEMSLHYEITLPDSRKPVAVEESPSLKPGDGPALARAFRISGLPAASKLALKLSGSADMWSVSGKGRLQNVGNESLLVFSANGETILTGTWTASK